MHCLTGCVLGEVAGMALGSILGLNDAMTVMLAVALAFVFGYALTMRPLLQSGMAIGISLRTALAGDTLSITIMEAIDNAFMLLVPGAMDAGFTAALFWVTLGTG